MQWMLKMRGHLRMVSSADRQSETQNVDSTFIVDVKYKQLFAWLRQYEL